MESFRQPCTVPHNSESHIYLLKTCTGCEGSECKKHCPTTLHMKKQDLHVKVKHMCTLCVLEGRKPKPINRDLRSTQYLLILLHSKQTCISINTNCEYRHQTLIINWQVLSLINYHLQSFISRNLLNFDWWLINLHHNCLRRAPEKVNRKFLELTGRSN